MGFGYGTLSVQNIEITCLQWYGLQLLFQAIFDCL